MAKRKDSQKGLILAHLKKKGSITALEALILYRIFRLAARIHDLRLDGAEIKTTQKKDITGKTYAQYRL